MGRLANISGKDAAGVNTNGVIIRKLDRLLSGAAPRVLDLFSGCGGLSLGFQTAGFQIIGAVDLDSTAALSHAVNFYKDASRQEQQLHAKPRDIASLEPGQLLKELGHEAVAESLIDVIVGGPPCQSFARVGRAKLREVADHPEAFLKDPRGNLYLRYLHYVRKLKPLALLMENVPDVLNYGGHNIAEEMCEVLSGLGYVCRYTLLNSVYYGVPQMRERMFLMAVSEEVGKDVSFPESTHWIELPRGYQGSRQVALQTVQSDLFSENRYYLDPPGADPVRCMPAVTAEEAIGDLPPITAHLEGKLKRGPRRFENLVPYPKRRRIPDYAVMMRTWPGYESGDGIYDHVIRCLPRDYEIFRRMDPGDQYPEAHRHALDLLDERLRALRRKGRRIRDGSKEYERLVRETVPPYDNGKFPNKWRKMERNLPARTLMAHLGKDGYSHIHYDSEQARTISVREAARLQSFPDGFAFAGTMNPAFRQIGNAVPPLLAIAIAHEMLVRLRGANVKKDRIEKAVCV